MSDQITHECGIALIRLRKPLAHYARRYGSPLYGFQKLFLLMEKQHNRGQDGVGIGCVKLGMAPGEPFMFRDRDIKPNSLVRMFNRQTAHYDALAGRATAGSERDATVKQHFDFGGEVLMGHLRYGTSGSYGKSSCQPYYRRSNWPTKNLMVMGNFNMTNARTLNEVLIERGQHPIFDTDTQTILEEIGFHLDEEHTRIYRQMRDLGVPGTEIPQVISERLDPGDILRRAARIWDGGYVMAGLIGNGDAFVLRDPHGIRPCFYFQDDEVVAFASERVPLMTVFEKSRAQVREVAPGQAVVVKNNGAVSQAPFAEPRARRSCSFERIYFSRGNDPQIYQERKRLGRGLVPQCLAAVGDDLEHAVFSYIPNTAEIAWYGLMDGLREHRRQQVKAQILQASAAGTLDEALLDRLVLRNWPRGEKVAHKDVKLRTFITQEKGRSQLVSHVYDVTYDLVRPDDTLVCLEDSIVRGTTLRESILKILARTDPKRIVMLSTAPQIRYPDCYGIDMSELNKFVAFQAAVELLKERGQESVLEQVYQDCLRQAGQAPATMRNHVRRIYQPFTAAQISAKIAELVWPADTPWQGEVLIVYQSIENLHAAIPEHRGDWYFTGDYPTPGGRAVLNQAYVNYYENRGGRSYEVVSLEDVKSAS